MQVKNIWHFFFLRPMFELTLSDTKAFNWLELLLHYPVAVFYVLEPLDAHFKIIACFCLFNLLNLK